MAGAGGPMGVSVVHNSVIMVVKPAIEVPIVISVVNFHASVVVGTAVAIVVVAISIGASTM